MLFTTTMTRMMAASSQSSPRLAARDSPAAPSSTKIMGSFIWAITRESSPGRLGAPADSPRTGQPLLRLPPGQSPGPRVQFLKKIGLRPAVPAVHDLTLPSFVPLSIDPGLSIFCRIQGAGTGFFPTRLDKFLLHM